ncbi:hypothetical protein PTSG_01396 [Salpingoeca rosetta]|uniref:N-acetylgalactosaminide beta-1,3-galactosyltransferase n=1 Tax=Salpingoeca rosetta (strain ATCC 50818 / BSB-021) TaxID=946362 RepID=F2U079_SALR5|nr:uncharacterized protein PTSG_01396 [Salpingoeca rosetta]EGD80807.1 hypothetical protein PTSG_01396 [Salpingoeca rosetta]|eukprot:XP_004997368.1 hypothetical protein PTSG_01396 [Salpingoeca rosetta]
MSPRLSSKLWLVLAVSLVINAYFFVLRPATTDPTHPRSPDTLQQQQQQQQQQHHFDVDQTKATDPPSLLQQQLEEQLRQRRELEAQLEAKQSEKQRLEQKHKAEKEQRERIEKQLEEKRQREEKHQQELEQKKSELERQQQRLHEQQQKLIQQQQEIEKHKEQQQLLEQEHETLLLQQKQLQEEQKQQREEEQQNQAQDHHHHHHQQQQQQQSKNDGGKQPDADSERAIDKDPSVSKADDDGDDDEGDDDDTQTVLKHQKAIEGDDDDDDTPDQEPQPEPSDRDQRNGGGDAGGDADDGGDGEGSDDDDETRGWDKNTALDALPYRNLLNQRTPRVLVFVITGGKKASVKTNRKAVLETWFDKDTYFVTLEDVPTGNVIRLSPEAEAGGHRGLPVKVKHMFQYMYEHFLDEYDWFVKADDDTYINMDRLKKTLSVYNPEIPVYIGKPFSTKTKGVDGPSPLWRDFTTIGFCHGGAGYVLSRELLRIVGPYFRDSPSVTALEDAAISSVLYQHSGVRCINTNARMFGGLDLVHNSHDQKYIMRTLDKYEKREPVTLVKTATIHSVKANTTYHIHDMYQRILQTPSIVEQTDKLAERDLESRRWQLVTSWNCTLTPPFPDQVAHDAICQQSALISEPPRRPQHIDALDAAVSEIDTYMPCAGADNKGSAPIFAFARLQSVRDEANHGPPRVQAGAAPPPGGDTKRNVVMVVIDSHNEQARASLALLVRSLRAVGSTADVVVFAPSRDWVEPTVKGQCGMRVVEFDNAKVVQAYQDAYVTKPTEDVLYFALFETFLQRYKQRYELALHARVDTFFQRNPFTTVPTRNGLVLFVNNPVVTMDQVECFAGFLRINEKATMVSVRVAMGTTQALRDFYARSMKPMGRARRCAFDALVMLNTFRKEYAQDNPVLVLAPWDGPLATLGHELEYDYTNETDARNRGRVVYRNVAGVATSIVTGYMNLLEFDAAGVLQVPTERPKTRVELALATLPARLHDPVLRTCSFHDPSPQEWPLSSKAYLRWSALAGAGAQTFDLNTFRPVWELLAQYNMYWNDPKQPSVKKVAFPATHRTGAAILSALYFRYAARHHLRVRHVGSWPFNPPEELNAEALQKQGEVGTYDMSMSQISAKGMWHSDFDTAVSYYNTLLGSDYKLTIMFEEPSQHYINWLYFFIIPKAQKKPPSQVLDEFLSHRFNRNLQMQELSVRTNAQFEEFVTRHLSRFDLILLRERLDECLVLMRRMFNWSLLDITYLKPVETGRRFDGKMMKAAPRARGLEPKVRDAIKNLLPLDYRMWELANKRLDDLIAQQPPDFQDEVIAFQKVQSALAEVCKAHPDHAVCRWYALSEYDIIGMIGPTGFTKAIPLL